MQVTRWRVVAAVVATLGAAIVIAGGALPWLRTGNRRRSSYDVFALVDRLGFSPSGPVGWAVRLWPVMPLLVTVAAVLAWQWRLWPFLVAAAVAVAYAGGVGIAVATADPPALLRVEPGPTVTACGAAAILLAALLAAFATFARHGDS